MAARTKGAVLLRLAEQMGLAIAAKAEPHVVVFRSTLVPGTVEDVLRPIIEAKSGKKDGEGFHLCFQPEFLREGSSIRDYDKPPFTIVGANHAYPVDRLRALFGQLPCEFIQTSVRSAEMMKYCCNNFHALKITFAKRDGAPVRRAGRGPVRGDGPGLPRYAAQHLACLPQARFRVRRFLPAQGPARDLVPGQDARTSRFRCCPASCSPNREHLDLALHKIVARGKRKIGFIGLSFKTGTDDLRESPLVTLAEQLLGKGMQLSVYDPEVHLAKLLGANRRYIENHLPHIGELLQADIREVIAESEVLVLGLTGQPVFDAVAAHARADQWVLDLVNMPGREAVAAAVEGLCW